MREAFKIYNYEPLRESEASPVTRSGSALTAVAAAAAPRLGLCPRTKGGGVPGTGRLPTATPRPEPAGSYRRHPRDPPRVPRQVAARRREGCGAASRGRGGARQGRRGAGDLGRNRRLRSGATAAARPGAAAFGSPGARAVQARPGPAGLRRRCPLPSPRTGSRGTPVCALRPPLGRWMGRAQLQPPRPLSALSSPLSPRLRRLPFSCEKREVALRRYLGWSASLTSPLNMINVPSARNETFPSPDCSKEESRPTSHLPNLRSPGGHTRVITGDCANAALSKSMPVL